MYSRIALVIMHDIKKFFPDTLWAITKQDNDGFIAKNEDNMIVNISPDEIKYRVVMKSQDDPGNNADEIVNRPLGFILKQMKSEFEGKSSDIYDELNKKKASFNRMAMRIAARSSDADFRMEKRILNNLNIEAKKNGWDFKLTNDEPPALIGDDDGFDVKIFVDSISWNYEFKLEGYPSGDHSGKTSDPIQEFQRWKRLNKLEEAEYNDDIDANVDTEKPTSSSTPTIR